MHSIRRFFHWSHEFIRNSFDNSNVFCKVRNEPVDIKNIDKVTACQKKKYTQQGNRGIGWFQLSSTYKKLIQLTYHPSNRNYDPTQVTLRLHSESVRQLQHLISVCQKQIINSKKIAHSMVGGINRFSRNAKSKRHIKTQFIQSTKAKHIGSIYIMQE